MTLRIAKLPKPERGNVDRRIQRSDNCAEALELALTSAAARANLDALLLVDDAGLLPDFFALLDRIEINLYKRKQHNTVPFIVAVEGLDGCGKSSLVARLAELLDKVATPH